MKIAPLIHSRTLHCDFHSNLAVRPQDLDVQWARGKILSATNNIENVDGIRKIVAYKGEICIAGIGCNFAEFVEKYLPSVKGDAEKYFQDDNGRYLKVFIGYAFKGSSIPDVSYLDLWKMFEKYFTPKWELKFFETVIAPYDYEVNEKNFTEKIQSPVEKISGVSFYIADEMLNDKLFNYCLAEKKDFCSNADQIKIINSGEFEFLSTSQNFIDRFKTESEKKNSDLRPARKIQNSTTKVKQKTTVLQSSKKYGSIALKVMAIIITILIILVIILLNR